jgi:hypothetical protein
MLGIAFAVDGDRGPETRHAITSFQMHPGILAYCIAAMQAEAKPLVELGRSSEFCSELLSPRQQ